MLLYSKRFRTDKELGEAGYASYVSDREFEDFQRICGYRETIDKLYFSACFGNSLRTEVCEFMTRIETYKDLSIDDIKFTEFRLIDKSLDIYDGIKLPTKMLDKDVYIVGTSGDDHDINLLKYSEIVFPTLRGYLHAPKFELTVIN